MNICYAGKNTGDNLKTKKIFHSSDKCKFNSRKSLERVNFQLINIHIISESIQENHLCL